MTESARDGAEYAHALSDNLGADAITGQYGYVCFHIVLVVTIRAGFMDSYRLIAADSANKNPS